MSSTARPPIEQRRIVIFDGICNLCDRSVRFIIARDPRARFCFAASQSKTGQALLDQYSVSNLAGDSLVLIDGDSCKVRSDAVLEIAAHLSWPWPLLAIFRVIPLRARDGIYQLIARHRYQIFGKKDQCPLPDPTLRSRFLTDD